MSTQSIAKLVKSSRPVIPQIYAYTTPEIARHNGWIKIGYTEQDVAERIAQQTHTADVHTRLEWRGNASYDDGSGLFKDTDFHAYLTRLGIGREQGTEWFYVTGPISHKHFIDFRINKGIVDTQESTPYVLRAEQERAVEKAADYARSHKRGEFLWNCKPRFGKTLAAYELMQRLDAHRVLIVTNRPAIADSWYRDYERFVGTQSYRFVSEVDVIHDEPACITYRQYLDLINSRGSTGSRNIVEFVSLQDLKGSIYFGGTYDKLEEVATHEWDLLIVDEAHEGVDTYKTDVAFDHIKRSFTLHLSGTPFKAIASEKFDEDAIFNWTYADEQQAKQDWDDTQSENPYAELPRLNLFTYQMSEIALEQAQQGIEIDGENTEYAFDLSEFFSTKVSVDKNGKEIRRFVHNVEVDRFLDALTTQEKFPFSTPELRDELRHTFWLLNRVDSAIALARKLRAHPVFKDYEIVLAAGDGRIDDADENMAALKRVKAAIATHDKTITLSVGQLTMGVTVPEWTGVLMLSNVKSPSLYMQAAFRAQNPCLFIQDGEFLRKENAYVFDFDPARTLTIYEQFANDLCTSTAAGAGDVDAHRRNVRTLLNFFPVIGEDDAGSMVELDVERVLSIPRRIHAREVVRRGFMCDFLFQNISCVFRAPAEVLEVIQGFEPYKAPNRELGIDPDTADDLDLNENGEVEIPKERIIGTAAELFGDKVYADIASNLETAIEEIVIGSTDIDEEEVLLNQLSTVFHTKMTEPLVAAAKESYSDDLKDSQQKRIERRIKADAEMHLRQAVGDFNIERNRIEFSRRSELEGSLSQEETDNINQRYDAQIDDARVELNAHLEASREELVRIAGETIVQEVETAKTESKKRDIETSIRDHLRGFSRTIPSFLMAYGDENTTLEYFDRIIPSEVFFEVTSITVEQFRFLRDGGDFKNERTGELEHFDGHLFDSVVFNDSVREFIRLRGKLANYLDENQESDIFDYVPPQRTNQIFTPRRVVEHMVDLFEEENPGCFDDPTHTFADLYMKSGLYITEIIKRLYTSDGMRSAFPDDRMRLNHIIEHQVYGIAPTEIIYQIATHYILGYDNEVGGSCKHNFVMADSAAMAKEGTLVAFVETTWGEKLS